MITVQSGANTQEISPVEGEKLTVGMVRERLKSLLGIDENSIAVASNGAGRSEVDDDHELAGDATLEFIKRSGTKG